METFRKLLFIPLLPFICFAFMAGCIYEVVEVMFISGRDWILNGVKDE